MYDSSSKIEIIKKKDLTRNVILNYFLIGKQNSTICTILAINIHFES